MASIANVLIAYPHFADLADLMSLPFCAPYTTVIDYNVLAPSYEMGRLVVDA